MFKWIGKYSKSLLLFFGISCASLPKSAMNANLVGNVYEHKYNSMPMIDKPNTKGAPFKTTLYFYEPTTIHQIEAGANSGPTISKIKSILVDSVVTDNSGTYSIYLKPGKYSVFVKYENGYYIPFYSGKDAVAIIETKQSEITRFDVAIRNSMSYE